MVIKKKRVKLNVKSKNVFLSIGALGLLVGTPISLVISCSSAVTDETAEIVSNISNIKPNSSGEFSAEFSGWSISIVSEDSIGKSDTLKLNNLNPGDKYLFQFKLEDGYATPIGLTEITLDEANAGTYYSSVFTFTGVAQILIQSEIEALIATSSAAIDIEFDGWETIEIVTSLKDTTTNEYVTFNNLVNDDEYKLKLTLASDYFVSSEMEAEFLILENGSYYTVKNYIFDNRAESINVAKLNSIYPTSSGEITKLFAGWNITIVDSIEADQAEIKSLVRSTLYFYKFTILDKFTAPLTLEELTLSDDGSYYSDLKLYVLLVLANDVNGLSNIIPSETGEIAQTFEGWEISVVDTIETNVVLDALIPSTTYFLKFTLLDGYAEPSELDGLLLNSNESYYSSERIFTEIAAAILDLDSITPNEMGILTQSFDGWDISMVESIESGVLIVPMNAGDIYYLKFTLQAGFIAPNELDGLILDDNNSYYSSERQIIKPASLVNLSEINPTADAEILNSVTGWDISVVSTIGSTQSVNSLGVGDSYYIRISLKTGFNVVTESDGFTLHANESYYSSSPIPFKVNAALITNEDIDGLIDHFGRVDTSNTLNDFEGWDWIIENENGNEISELPTGSPINYNAVFTLKSNYSFSANSVLNYDNGSRKYYSDSKTYLKAASVTGLDLRTEFPNLDATFKTYTGWDITVRDPNDNALNSIKIGDEFSMRLLIKDEYKYITTPSDGEPIAGSTYAFFRATGGSLRVNGYETPSLLTLTTRDAVLLTNELMTQIDLGSVTAGFPHRGTILFPHNVKITGWNAETVHYQGTKNGQRVDFGNELQPGDYYRIRFYIDGVNKNKRYVSPYDDTGIYYSPSRQLPEL